MQNTKGYRHGYADGLLGIDSGNPYPATWRYAGERINYSFGYHDGSYRRKANGITLTVLDHTIHAIIGRD